MHGLMVGTLAKSTNACVAASGQCKAVYPNACGPRCTWPTDDLPLLGAGRHRRDVLPA